LEVCWISSAFFTFLDEGSASGTDQRVHPPSLAFARDTIFKTRCSESFTYSRFGGYELAERLADEAVDISLSL
jgi:hypothetical protein